MLVPFIFRAGAYTMLPYQEVLLLYPAPFGALTQLFAGTMPEALNYNGEVRRLQTCYIVLLVFTTHA